MAKKKKKKSREDREERIVVPTRGGLNKSSYKRRTDDNRTRIKEGETVPLQFFALPTNKRLFKEGDVHQWMEGKNSFKWVPCLGEDLCPLCDDDDEDISKTAYFFVTPIWNFKTKKYEILRGGRNMAGKMGLRFERLKKAGKEKLWLRKAWDLTAIPAAFTDYDIVTSDTKKAIELDESKMINPADWLYERVKDHYGDDMPTASSLDDDDEDDEDEDDDEPPKKRKRRK